MAIVYAIRNKINDKVYIGYAKNKSERKSNHFSRLRANKHPNIKLQNSYNKHGHDSFEFIVIDECDIEYACAFEHYWCYMFNSHNDLYGYNIKPTNPEDICYRASEHTKKLIGSYNKGKIISQEQREKIRKSMLQDEVKERIKAGALKRTGIKQTPEHIAKRVSYHLGAKRSDKAKLNMWNANNTRKVVYQFDTSFNLIASYNSATEAGDAVGVSVHAISKCANGENKTSAGYIWSYEKDFNKEAYLYKYKDLK